MSAIKTGFKVVFRKIRGRIVPVRVSLSRAPDDVQKVNHSQRIRNILRTSPTADPGLNRKSQGIFFKIAQRDSKQVGKDIAKRVAKLRQKNGLTKETFNALTEMRKKSIKKIGK